MISQPVAEQLSRQIGSELYAHQNYMAISLYFKRQSLDGWAKLFFNQSVEEAQHAMKIMNFLTDCNVEFDLPDIKGCSTRFGSALEAVQAAAASERRVSQQFGVMAKTAMEQGDFFAFQFLQWFIEEQVEEEAKMQKLIDLVESGVNLFQAQSLLQAMEDEE